MPDLSKEEMKAIFKSALKEWLDEKFLTFGKWAAATFFAAVMGAFFYFVVWAENIKDKH